MSDEDPSSQQATQLIVAVTQRAGVWPQLFHQMGPDPVPETHRGVELTWTMRRIVTHSRLHPDDPRMYDEKGRQRFDKNCKHIVLVERNSVRSRSLCLLI